MDCIPNLKNCKAECCRSVNFHIRLPTADRIYYYELHGCKVTRISREIYNVSVPVKCTALTEDNLCSLHNTNKKPRLCVNFDEKYTEGYFIPESCLLSKNKDREKQNIPKENEPIGK